MSTGFCQFVLFSFRLRISAFPTKEEDGLPLRSSAKEGQTFFMCDKLCPFGDTVCHAIQGRMMKCYRNTQWPTINTRTNETSNPTSNNETIKNQQSNTQAPLLHSRPRLNQIKPKLFSSREPSPTGTPLFRRQGPARCFRFLLSTCCFLPLTTSVLSACPDRV
jgi:hypothetical protein